MRGVLAIAAVGGLAGESFMKREPMPAACNHLPGAVKRAWLCRGGMQRAKREAVSVGVDSRPQPIQKRAPNLQL